MEAVMKIGSFQRDQYGNMTGKIYGLGFGAVPVSLEPETSKDGKPYFKVIADPHADSYEIGAAFEKQKDGLTCHSVSIDSPALKAPLNAALFPDKEQAGAYNLVWDRPEPPKPKLQANAESGPTKNRRHISAGATP
jgi:uncharacterized protein (DUF736 family)